MGGGLAVGGHDGPAVGELPDLRAPEVHHRLDRDRHAGFQLGLDLAAVVGDVRLLVQRAADPVTDKFAHDVVAVGDDKLLDRLGNVMDPVARARLLDADGQSLLRFFQEPRGGRGDLADPMVVAVSPTQPRRTMPMSSLTMSPYWTRRAPPMPCTISSLTEMQMLPGKPR